MALISLRTTAFAAVFFLLAGNLAFSQNYPSVTAEITALGKKASNAKLSEAERKDAMERMARLYELSGSMKEAAETWERSAILGPGLAAASGYQALLQSARCYTAIGEFDKANAALKPVLSTQGQQSVKARLLSAWIESFKTGRIEALNALLPDPDFSAYKPGVYYAIWRISGNTGVKSAMMNRLLAEFPQSPEARIIRDDSRVNALPTALWILSVLNFPAVAGPSTDYEQVAHEQAAAAPFLLQTGIFSREENARALSDRLKKAGFSPVISQKTVQGELYWVVGVAPGQDSSRTTLLLKDKGFESFPVYEK
jgi:tetratricopeptide (TPR) repeat protein